MKDAQQVLSITFSATDGGRVYASYLVRCPGCAGEISLSGFLVGHWTEWKGNPGWEFRPLYGGLREVYLNGEWPECHCPRCDIEVALTRKLAESLPYAAKQWAIEYQRQRQEQLTP